MDVHGGMEALHPGRLGSREGWSMAVSLVGLLALTIGAVIFPMNLGLKRLGAMRIRMKNGRMPTFSYHQAKHPTLRTTSPLQALRETRKK